MAFKLSISFPSGVIVTIESEDTHVIGDMVQLVLKGLPADPMHISPSAASSSPQQVSDDATVEESALPQAAAPEVAAPQAAVPEVAVTQAVTSGLEGYGNAPEELVHFCRRMAPTVDMRRVVVAAEGARRYWGLEGVSPRELADIFDQAGWPRPGDFVQTLRNAARRKFGWLERMRGKPHYYVVTDKGREKIIGQSGR